MVHATSAIAHLPRGMSARSDVGSASGRLSRAQDGPRRQDDGDGEDEEVRQHVGHAQRAAHARVGTRRRERAVARADERPDDGRARVEPHDADELEPDRRARAEQVAAERDPEPALVRDEERREPGHEHVERVRRELEQALLERLLDAEDRRQKEDADVRDRHEEEAIEAHADPPRDREECGGRPRAEERDVRQARGRAADVEHRGLHERHRGEERRIDVGRGVVACAVRHVGGCSCRGRAAQRQSPDRGPFRTGRVGGHDPLSMRAGRVHSACRTRATEIDGAKPRRGLGPLAAPS